MVKHIVMFKLKEKNAENMEAAVLTLRGLDLSLIHISEPTRPY